MHTPLVSAVMVTRNVETYLAEAIEGILGQTFSDFEFVIVDFGSTDSSPSIVSKYASGDRRIRLATISPCSLAEARNAAFARAGGRYAAIVDADDISVRDRLKCQVDFMEMHPDVGVLGGAIEWMDASGRQLATILQPIIDPEIRLMQGDSSQMCQPAVMVRTEAFVAAGGYRSALAQAEDYDLWLRIAERYRLANLEQILVRYRIHANQLSVRRRTEQTLCILAAKAAAAARRKGDPDPLIGVEGITYPLLQRLGMTEDVLQNTLATECIFWIGMMSRAGEYAAALNAAADMLRSSKWRSADRRLIANLRIATAALHWRAGQWWPSILLIGQAVMARPWIVGRPFKRLMNRIRQAARPAESPSPRPSAATAANGERRENEDHPS